MIVDLGLAFVAGLLSFASTCVLPLVPAYVAYMGGQVAAGSPQPGIRQQARVLGNAFHFVLGFTTAFAVGWTPCVGPILAAILIRAGASNTAGQGAILLATYSAGLGIPFLLAAGLSGVIMQALSRIRGAYGAINAVAAVFLIGMGVL